MKVCDLIDKLSCMNPDAEVHLQLADAAGAAWGPATEVSALPEENLVKIVCTDGYQIPL